MMCTTEYNGCMGVCTIDISRVFDVCHKKHIQRNTQVRYDQRHIYLSISLPIYLSTCWSVCLYTCQSVCLSICPSFICQSIYKSVELNICFNLAFHVSLCQCVLSINLTCVLFICLTCDFFYFSFNERLSKHELSQ